MILGRYLLTALGLDLKFYKNVIIGGDGPYGGCSSPMVDINDYNFKYLIDEMVNLEEYFINMYVK